MDIKAIRKQLGLTAEELARELGVSVTTVSRWEAGRHKPSKLARARIRELLRRSKAGDSEKCPVWDFPPEDCPLFGGSACPGTCSRWGGAA